MQFGKCNLDGKPVDAQELQKVRDLLARYGPDAEDFFCQDNVGVIYRAFHITKESRLENQPHVFPSGSVLTWDGRLDNREDLIGQLGDKFSTVSTDVSIVAAAYERWGTDAFVRLVGDWAISIWDQASRSLLLAKDFIGTRHLYYSIDKDQITWSTILDPLVLLSDHSFVLQEEYIAGWLTFFPAPHLTPYVGIHSVPPSSFVCAAMGTLQVKKYWEFDPTRKIRHHSDAEYEEHFRLVFAESVRRRLRSSSPVLAELSGGMDSSSIVCMADRLIARAEAETPRLDTVSYYDDSEPNWNERPYFAKVEAQRGRAGCHIDVASDKSFGFDSDSNRFAVLPGAAGGRLTSATRQFATCVISQGNRVLLSGIGGDEFTGGLPTPVPELSDLLVEMRFKTLAHQLIAWGLSKRQPWFHLFLESFRQFLPLALVGTPAHMRPARWLRRDFVARNRAALTGYQSRLKLFGSLPSFQENISTLDGMRRQLACALTACEPPYEKRYPYLDRDLLEFIFAIPREQLVRPYQRRSLMRRALVGIVPDELLNRPRKAFVARSPMAAIVAEWAHFVEMSQHMVSSLLGIVDEKTFDEAVQMARHGQEIPLVTVIRTLGIETWLRTIREQKVAGGGRSTVLDSEVLGQYHALIEQLL